MSALPRGICPVCGLEVALRVGGKVREHRQGTQSANTCPGSGEIAAVTPKRRVEDIRTARKR